ncbi:MAG: aldo/keto reductase [Candidatus Hydrogenedentes bacterium]|nr:aldo/keto reductase [Candidatus Hydrogenedentota bacterium]
MTTNTDIPLILGGHSFISQLGNEPQPDEAAQCKIVEACLDHGIAWFDTTHQPERIALGRALKKLGRRREATIIAWNFMQVLRPEDKLDRPVELEERHLQQFSDELQTDYIDCLVLHELDQGTEEQHKRQEALAVGWQKQGYVKQLGVWAPGENALEKYGLNSPYSFMVRPYNIKSGDLSPIFAACKKLGWQNFACSPFIRGWELDKMLKKAANVERGNEGALRAKLADLMLRFSLFQPNVDRLICAMRRVQWVGTNVESCHRGPLNDSEMAWLDSLCQMPDT